jgi:5-methylcytosine-specific restriction protein A
MPKLQSLKSSLQVARGRLSTLQPLTTQTTERKRGWAGVQDRDRIRRRDEGLCQGCKRNNKVSVGVHVDHIVPLWKGGSDEDANKELLCRPCHDEKSAVEAAERAAGG